jgi:hypothetical protein
MVFPYLKGLIVINEILHIALVYLLWCLCIQSLVVGIGADPGFNATTTHQQNPNYQPFRQHLRSR